MNNRLKELVDTFKEEFRGGKGISDQAQKERLLEIARLQREDSCRATQGSRFGMLQQGTVFQVDYSKPDGTILKDMFYMVIYVGSYTLQAISLLSNPNSPHIHEFGVNKLASAKFIAVISHKKGVTAVFFIGFSLGVTSDII